MDDKLLWSRRRFSKAIVSLQAVLAAGVLNIPIGCTNETVKNGEILNSSQENLLKLAMDEIIPKSDNMPSASEVGGIEYILSVFKEYPELVDGFQRVLTNLKEHTKASAKVEFEKLDQQSRVAALKEFEQEQPDLFAVLKNLVYESYYINEKVWELIGYEPYPTLSAGPQMDPFDEALLTRVKKMSPFYLKVQTHGYRAY